MVAPDDSIEVNALPDAVVALGDLLHLNDISDTNASFKETVQNLIALYDTLTATMTNKTLTTPIISAISNTGTVTLPTATDTLVGKATTDILTNKTIDANGTGNSISNIDVADLANGTDGELITWDSAAAPTTVAAGTSGQVLTSNGAGAEPTFQAAAAGGTTILTAVKTADETVNNSTTLQDDDHLVIALEANKSYTLQMYLELDGGSTPDFKHDFTVPAGTTGQRSNGDWSSGVIFLDADFGASSVTSTNGSSRSVPFIGFITTSGTAGNFQLQWAQNVANVSNTIVRAGSWLMATEVG